MVYAGGCRVGVAAHGGGGNCASVPAACIEVGRDGTGGLVSPVSVEGKVGVVQVMSYRLYVSVEG